MSLAKSCVFIVVVLSLLSAVSAAPVQGPYKSEWSSLEKHNAAPDWFRDDKFGIYFHWGVYSVPAFGSEWYPRNMHEKGSGVYRHHVATYGDPGQYGYDKFVPQFKAEKFDADAWAELFVKAGAKFAGPVAEHHDGFAMWASKATPWNAKDMGPKRDLTGELEKAIRKRGMKFVTTFHHARNNLWQKNGRWTGHYDGALRDWPAVLDDPQRAILYGYMPRERFLNMWRDKLYEVIDNYQPDLIWFDSWLDEIPDAYQMDFLAHYLNSAATWGRDVVITTKHDIRQEVAVDDYEKGRADKLTDFVWLTDDTISKGSWCYTNDLQIKSTAEVLHTFIDIVSKNGQLLLNISPMADGSIPENQKAVLLEMGRWLSRFSEAIYGTRPWLTYGEGPTQMSKGGHFVQMKSGYNAQDIRYTSKGSTVYAMTLGKPAAGAEIVMTSFSPESLQGDLKVVSVSMLGHRGTIRHEMRDDGLAVMTPAQPPDALSAVFKIETTGSAEFLGAASRITLEADKALLDGEGVNLETKVGGRQNVGFWDNSRDKLHWLVKIPSAGTYAIDDEFACPSSSRITFETAGRSLTADIPGTGGFDKPKTVNLGRIDFDQAGVYHVILRPTDRSSWKAINLWQLILKPVRR